MPLFLFFKTQTMHIKSKTHNSIAMFFLKTLYPGGIRTRVIKKYCLVANVSAHSFLFSDIKINAIIGEQYQSFGERRVRTKPKSLVTNKISGAKMSRGLPFPFFCLLHCLMC
jgi:hypothetical protein